MKGKGRSVTFLGGDTHTHTLCKIVECVVSCHVLSTLTPSWPNHFLVTKRKRRPDPPHHEWMDFSRRVPDPLLHLETATIGTRDRLLCCWTYMGGGVHHALTIIYCSASIFLPFLFFFYLFFVEGLIANRFEPRWGYGSLTFQLVRMLMLSFARLFTWSSFAWSPLFIWVVVVDTMSWM